MPEYIDITGILTQKEYTHNETVNESWENAGRLAIIPNINFIINFNLIILLLNWNKNIIGTRIIMIIIIIINNNNNNDMPLKFELFCSAL